MKCVALTYGADSQSRPIEMAPDSAVVYRGNPWFVPDTDRRWQASFWLAAVIDRLGKNISARFARRYYNNVCLAAHPASDADAEPLPIRPYTFFRPMLAPLVLTFFVTFSS